MSNLQGVGISGPLKPFANGFAAELRRQGYTLNSTGAHLRLMAHLSRWLVAEDLNLEGLYVTQVERFLSARRAAGYANHLTEKALRPMLTYLRQVGVVPMPPVAAPEGVVEEMLERYRHYLTVERGLGKGTARGYVDAVRPFLGGRISPDGLTLELNHLSAANVQAFVVARCPAQSRSSAKLTITALRSFLGFLHVEGMIERPLAAAVPSVAGWRLAELPKGLDAKEVRRLLKACDRRTQMGRRDFAMLTMLARLGLRSGEVSSLLLEDIDWRAGTLAVRGKGNQMERLPLPADVGEAVAAYLRRGRPANTEDRSVFVRIKAPNRGLSSAGVTQVVAAAGRRAGLGTIYAHRLRHTAATETLRAGASLPEVGQLLRHRRPLTTVIYAKVNREALRTIARTWPGGVA